MSYSVIVPLHSKPLFEKQENLEVEPIFYQLHNESLIVKIRQKLSLIDPAKVLAQRLEFTASEERVREARAVWLSSVAYFPPAQMDCFLDRLPRLKWVFSQVTGTEHLNLNSFRHKDIMVSNIGDMSSLRVAEMALACIFSHAKRLPEHIAMQRKRKWKSLVCSDINRQTVGIIGTGNIGTEIARLCSTVGMHVIGASRDPARILSNNQFYNQVIKLDAKLDDLLRQSDHVIIALPLNDQTRGLIGWEALSRMKANASIVNIARGAIVDEDALCRALSQRVIGAAYIDTPEKIPLPRWSLMYQAPNLVLTHYSSANSPYTLDSAFQQFISGLEKLSTGSQPVNLIL